MELDGAGSHPAAWRVSRTAPASGLDPEHLRGAVLAAESAGFHAATFTDPGLPGHPDQQNRPGPDAAARLNALQRAAFAGPVTRSIALIPEVDTVYTEPFHISTQLASLDYVSGGRAGWLVAASTKRGRRRRRRTGNCARGAALAQEAADSIEVGRRLWDSWEDDAVIRDVPTGRYLDVDKLHYIDVENGELFRQGSVDHSAAAPGPAPSAGPGRAAAPRKPSRPGRSTRSWSRPRRPSCSPPSSRRRGQASPLGAGGPALIAELDVVLRLPRPGRRRAAAALDAHTAWQSPRARFVGVARPS